MSSVAEHVEDRLHAPMPARAARTPQPHLAERKRDLVVHNEKTVERDREAVKQFQNRPTAAVHIGERLGKNGVLAAAESTAQESERLRRRSNLAPACSANRSTSI